MSERGSFTSQFFYCRDCYETVRHALGDAARLTLLEPSDVKVVAGFVSGS